MDNGTHYFYFESLIMYLGAQTLMLTMLATSLALVPWARLFTLSLKIEDTIQDARAATWG